jgi:hypothetical protein
VGRLLLYIDGDDDDAQLDYFHLRWFFFLFFLFFPNIVGIFELVLTGLKALSTENGS